MSDVESGTMRPSAHRAGFRASLFAVQPLLNIAVRAARRAGEVIVRSLNRVDTLAITAKGRNDFVTEVDHAAEREIIASIRRSYPDHAFLAEESGVSGDSDTVWIIDPLDGTTNFLHGMPVFAVSIACQIRGRLEHAVVYDPMRQEIFTASRGGGAHVDNRRLRVSAHKTLEGALIGTGFPYRENIRYLDEYLQMMKAVIQNTAGVRRPGAAALDLAYVAAGGWMRSGNRAEPLGHRGRHLHPGSRRAYRHAQRRGVHPGRQHPVRRPRLSSTRSRTVRRRPAGVPARRLIALAAAGCSTVGP